MESVKKEVGNKSQINQMTREKIRRKVRTRFSLLALLFEWTCSKRLAGNSMSLLLKLKKRRD